MCGKLMMSGTMVLPTNSSKAAYKAARKATQEADREHFEWLMFFAKSAGIKDIPQCETFEGISSFLRNIIQFSLYHTPHDEIERIRNQYELDRATRQR